jgi:hypothetical protein
MVRIFFEEYNASVTSVDGEPLKSATEHGNIRLMDYFVNHGAILIKLTSMIELHFIVQLKIVILMFTIV